MFICAVLEDYISK